MKSAIELGRSNVLYSDTSAIGGQESILFGKCECAYDALPENTAIYNKPADKATCEDIHEPPPKEYNPVTNPVRRQFSPKIGLVGNAWQG